MPPLLGPSLCLVLTPKSLLLLVQPSHSFHQLPFFTAASEVDKISRKDFFQLSDAEKLNVIQAAQVWQRGSANGNRSFLRLAAQRQKGKQRRRNQTTAGITLTTKSTVDMLRFSQVFMIWICGISHWRRREVLSGLRAHNWAHERKHVTYETLRSKIGSYIPHDYNPRMTLGSPYPPFKNEFTWSLSWKSGSKVVTCVGGVGDSGGAESSSEIRDGVERSGASLVMWQLRSCCMVVSPGLSAVGASATVSHSEACWQRTSSTSSSFAKIKGRLKNRL